MRNILMMVLCVVSLTSIAQTVELVNDEVRQITYQGKSYLVGKSLTIKPPQGGQFKVSASTDGPFFIRMTISAQEKNNTVPSPGINSIREESVLVPGVTSENQIPSLNDNARALKFTYIDGMGRTIQTVKANATPNNNDIIEAMYFDGMGNKTLKYLPYVRSENEGGFRTAYDSETRLFYTSNPLVAYEPTRPFEQTIFENSSLGRISEVFGAGNDWYTANRRKQSRTRIDASGSVKKWVYIDDNTPPTFGVYDSLLVKESIDEENHATREFIDKRGLTVLKQTQESGDYFAVPPNVTWLDTYFVYDDFGVIRIVIPPEASSRITTEYITDAETKKRFLNRWCFQYRYDDKGNVIAKWLPGWTGWEYTIYDKWNRVALTQNPAQVSRNEWTFTKFDRFNRGIMTGLLVTSEEVEDLRSDALESSTRFEVIDNSPVGYTVGTTYPTDVSSEDLITITYYDNYYFLQNLNWDASSNTLYNPVAVSGFLQPSSFLTNIMGHVTGSKVRVLKENDWLNSVTYYDGKYRPVQTITENYVGGRDRKTTKFDFTGRVLLAHHHHTSSSATLTILKEFAYDHAGRVLRVYQTMDNGPRILLAENEYNDIGQLVETNIHSSNDGGSFLQSVDRRYNVRGWITNINNSTLSNDGTTNNDSNDLFGMDILYHPSSPPLINGFPSSDSKIYKLYNGNISAIKWKSDTKRSVPEERIYGFKYDALDRLMGAHYATNSAGVWSGNSGMFDEIVKDYDRNGNIQGIMRYAKVDGAKDLIDNTTYYFNYTKTEIPNFTGESNRLIKIQDSEIPLGFSDGANSDEEFKYDASGNLKYDGNKQISNIVYNHFNLPEVVEFTRPDSKIDRIRYRYDATGTRLSTTVYKNGNASSNGTRVWTTEYSGEIQYDQDQEASTRKLSFVSNPEGRVVSNGSSYDYEYFYRDHQGNVRLAYGQMKETFSYRATMEDPPVPSNLGNEEEETFYNIQATRYQNSLGENFNYTKSSDQVFNPDKSSHTNGFISSKIVGPAKRLNLSANDRVKMEVFAKYTVTTGNSSLVAGGALVSAVTGTFNITPGENPALYSGFSSNVPLVPGSGSGSSTLPKAYLAFLFFSINDVFITSGAVPISTSAFDSFEKLERTFTAPQDGHLYVYVINESNVNAVNGSVYFDEMLIVHQKNNSALQVIQASDYYPFGLAFNKFQSERISGDYSAVQKNRYGFQGQEFQKDLDLGWSQFKWRMHDPAIGRFVSVDPLSEKFKYNSTFAFSENKVVSHIELEGLESVFNVAMGSAETGYTEYSQFVDDGTAESQMTISEARKDFDEDVEKMLPKEGAVTVMVDKDFKFQGFTSVSENDAAGIESSKELFSDISSFKEFLMYVGNQTEKRIAPVTADLKNKIKRVEIGFELSGGIKGFNAKAAFGTYSESEHTMGVFGTGGFESNLNNVTVNDFFTLDYNFSFYLGFKTNAAQRVVHKYVGNIGSANVSYQSNGDFKLGIGFRSPKWDVRAGGLTNETPFIWQSGEIQIGND